MQIGFALYTRKRTHALTARHGALLQEKQQQKQ